MLGNSSLRSLPLLSQALQTNSTNTSSQHDRDRRAPMPPDRSTLQRVTTNKLHRLPQPRPHSSAEQAPTYYRSTTLCSEWIASQHPDTCFTPMMPQVLCTIKTETRKLTPTRLSPIHNSALFLDSHPMLSDNSSSCHGQAGGPAQIWTTLCFQWTSDQLGWPEAMPKFTQVLQPVSTNGQ